MCQLDWTERPLTSYILLMCALGDGSSISAGLTAAGYDMGRVLQGFEATAACYPAVCEADGPDGVVAGRVAGLIKALEAVSSTCSVFAVPHCCNNPGCSNLAGASELDIVSGKGCICGGCQVVRYCATVGRAARRHTGSSTSRPGGAKCCKPEPQNTPHALDLAAVFA
jgi:hypothetical protein